MRAIVNISLTPQLNNLVNQTVSRGQYASKSEFFRHLIRTWAKQNKIDLINLIDLKENK
ncbi:ribbon-helix-helix domain-containing protein [Patescibacteria group bacterium]|nr:ribbon-helix-helix domain-containing protein [Patescibacteria group bacterium]